jgi:hypothetical protein
MMYITTKDWGRYPRDIRMVLICDRADHDPEVVGSQTFTGGFIGCYRDAMAAGWKDTFAYGQRVFYGPCCSGKKGSK